MYALPASIVRDRNFLGELMLMIDGDVGDAIDWARLRIWHSGWCICLLQDMDVSAALQVGR